MTAVVKSLTMSFSSAQALANKVIATMVVVFGLLHFSYPNTKLRNMQKQTGKVVYSLDLPAGFSCPGSNKCQSFFNPITRKQYDGVSTEYRCYAAKDEKYAKVFEIRWNNYAMLLQCKTPDEIVTLLENSYPKSLQILRLHSSGDIFNKRYFDALVKFATNHPEIDIYGYTKILPYVIAQKPSNFHLAYSMGGLFDSKAEELNVTRCYVVMSASDTVYPVLCEDNDSDDYYHIMNNAGGFALLVHGTQPAGSEWGKAAYKNQKAKRAAMGK